MIRGSCLCGAVRLEIAGTPRSLSYCHCSRCRKAEGVFAAVLIPAGLSLAIRDPEWCALVLPRSGLGHREGLR